MPSYHRKCKHCGSTIQMRQMPHGQWVAFEGYDTLHDCSKPISREYHPKTPLLFEPPPSEKKESGSYDDLEFPDINIPRQASKKRGGPLVDSGSNVGSFPSNPKEKPAYNETRQSDVIKKKTTSIPSGFWWIIFWLGIILLLILIR